MQKDKILVIDDDESIRNLCGEILAGEEYDVVLSPGGKEGLEMFGRGDLNLVLVDIHMSELDGFEVVRRIREKDRDIPVIAMTGFGTVDNAVNALKLGASDFIPKPFDLESFLQKIRKNLEIGALAREVSKLKMVETILELNRAIVALTSIDVLLERVVSTLYSTFKLDGIGIYLAGEDRGNFILRKKKKREGAKDKFRVSFREEEVSYVFETKKIKMEDSQLMVPLLGKERNIGFITMIFSSGYDVKEAEIKFLEAFAMQVSIGMDNASFFMAVRDSYLNAISSLVNSLEAKDAYTKGHSEQVAYYAVLLGKHMNLDARELEILQNAAYLHDLGKLGIKDSVLLKPGSLEKEELELIRKHPEITVKILEPLGLKKEEIEACFYHHEKVDGSGYPRGLSGTEIPLLAKILSVADAYSAMISMRPYRSSMTSEQAVAELEKWSGSQFDAGVVNAFVSMLSDQAK